jgi:hypothetical protein
MLTGTEREVVVLNAILELIDSIVNHEVLLLGDADPTVVMFKSSTHGRYFNIVVVDLLSQTDKNGLIDSLPYLRALHEIAERPAFDVDGSIGDLRTCCRQFRLWLEGTCTIERVWLPSVAVETDIQLSRLDLMKIAGNICRHNVLRAVGIAEDVRRLLCRNAVTINLDQALLALSDLYEWLHTDVFHYHSSTIAEFLNNLRWGIYSYLQPHFRTSIVWDEANSPVYGYTVPRELESEYAKHCYWDLMNKIRQKPPVRQFQVDPMLKRRY